MTAIDNITRLHNMQDAAQEILGFMRGKNRENLENDRLLLLAVIKDLEIIGEAAGRVTAYCRARYPQIPWLDIIGMRNRLIHAYFDINLDVVWQTIQNDLVPLIQILDQVIQKEC